jgi:hypothetical protein
VDEVDQNHPLHAQQSQQQSQQQQQQQQPQQQHSEGDAAAGLARASAPSRSERSGLLITRRSSLNTSSNSHHELGHSSSAHHQHTTTTPRRGKRDQASSETGVEMNALLSEHGEPSIKDDESWDDDDYDEEEEFGTDARPRLLSSCRDVDQSDENASEEGEDDGQTGLERFTENHPRITRIGTFFFFRSTSTVGGGDSATYAPSGPSVFGAALDLSMPILFNFHLFIEAYNHVNPEDSGSEVPAKILPLIFLSVLIVRSFIPPSRRRRFWAVLKFTAMAPFYRMRYRDAFLGDVLTSLVRPIQDILFALSYYATVIYGTVFGSYGLADAGLILERSWFLHNVILPTCALLPLWWKFLQTLRQSYDAKKRWPFYGDSFKYLSAAMLIIYGMTHPEDRRSPWWLVCFVLATLYQIIWDTLVDWELFVIAPRAEGPPTVTEASCEPTCCAQISSLRPSSRFLLVFQMYILQPIADGARRLSASIPSFEQIHLRPKRLYKTEKFYWKIFIANALLRYTWMLCFIPAYRLTSYSGEEKVTTFSSDVNSYIGVILPVVEIIRRCLWGFLKLEVETLRIMDEDILYSQVDESESSEDEVEEKDRKQLLPTWLDVQQKQQHDAAVSSSRSRIAEFFEFSDEFLHKLFVAELSLWAVAFVGFGYMSAS